MAKKTINSVTGINNEEKSVTPRQINKLSKDVLFEPSSVQQKAKARFWSRFQSGPLANPSMVSLTEALATTNIPQLKKWWDDKQFVEWFLNKDEERERIKFLFNKGLDTMENILDNPEANANAKANIIKMLAEMNGYLGKKPEVKFSDESINKMSEAQLQDFLSRKGVKLVQETVVDVVKKEEKQVD